MTGLGLTSISQFHALPGWEQRLHMRCAVEDDRRAAEINCKSLEYMASIWCGPSDEPTPENPVTEKTIQADGQEIRVKKIEDFEFEGRTAELRQKSLDIRRETEPFLRKMREEKKARMRGEWKEEDAGRIDKNN